MIDFGSRLKAVMDEIKPKETISLASIKWSDPRKDDMPEDSECWIDLMELIDHHPELHANLAVIREGGARLIRGHKIYLIKPVYDETGRTGWSNEAEYMDARKGIIEYKPTLEAALLKLHHKRCSGR